MLRVSAFGPACPLDASTPPVVAVHCFDMPWSEIAERIPTYAEMGFDAVQIPPVFPHYADEHRRWWQVYQPTRLDQVGTTASGNVEDFRAMIRASKEHGVRLIADLVINHRSGMAEGRDTTGATFTRYNYPDGTSERDFHLPPPGWTDNSIRDYMDRWQVQFGALVGLDDLATERPAVRLRIAVGIALCVLEGLDAFRIDAAKHMPASDLAEIYRLTRRLLAELAEGGTEDLAGRLALDGVPREEAEVLLAPIATQHAPEAIREALARGGKFWLFQEVIDLGHEPISAHEYTPLGAVTEFRYCKLAENFRERLLIDLRGIGGVLQDPKAGEPLPEWWNMVPAEKAVVCIANHDNQRGHGGGGQVLTHRDGKLYDLAHAFMLAWPYGTPILISSYEWKDADQGRPPDRSKWVDEEHRPNIAGMVGFRRETDGEPAVDWWSNGYQAIAFSRGEKGFFALSKESFAVELKIQTRLPPGTYVNVASGRPQPDSPTVVVDEKGRIRTHLEPYSALALHVGARR